MKHTAAVGIGHRVADRDETPQQLAQGSRPVPEARAGPAGGVESVMRILERLPADQPHGVARVTPVVGPQAVDRHHPGVLEPAGHLRLEQEPPAALGIGGAQRLDELQGDLAVQVVSLGREHITQATLGVKPQVVVTHRARGRLTWRLSRTCRPHRARRGQASDPCRAVPGSDA